MFFSNYSANTLFDSIFLVLYNTLYTRYSSKHYCDVLYCVLCSLPVMVYAILEQNQPGPRLASQPALYRQNRGNSLMSRRQLLRWTGLGLWHATVCFFVW